MMIAIFEKKKKESYSIIIRVIFAAIFHDNKVIMFHIKNKPVHLHISFFEKSFCTKPIVSIQNTILRRKK